MTAADVQAIAESATALTALGVVATWVWRTSRRAWKWRRAARAKKVRDDAFPLVVTSLLVAELLRRALGKGR
jgi:hypothetical protein